MSLSTSRSALLVCVLLVTATTVAAAPKRPAALSCYACIVVEGETGEVLWGRREHTALPNASTTKMVTALLVARATKGKDLVHVSTAAASVGGAGLDLMPGDVMTVRDLLYALLLDSSNEAAAALAEHVSGTQERFVGRMNSFARRIGASDSTFANPHGLDATGHSATAYDLAVIGLAVLDDAELAPIVATRAQTISTPRGDVISTNRNPLLETYRGAVGIKTGQTSGAGNVLVAAAIRRGRTLVAVAMRATDAGDDSSRLLDFGFAQPGPVEAIPTPTFTPAPTPTPTPEVTTPSPTPDPLQELDPVAALVFDPGGAIAVVPTSAGDADLVASGVATFVPAQEIVLPVTEGEMVGVMRVETPDGEIEEVDAVAADEIRSWSPSLVTRVMTGVLRTAATIAGGITA